MFFDNMKVKIKDVQMEQLGILMEFDSLCKKNDIKYHLFAGTLLGSVRHKGFIPWDDDIDVCMLRNDYHRFLEVCERDLNKELFLQTYKTDKNYINQFAKIRKNNTLFVEKSTAECDIHKGIYIDVFPMDNILPDTFLGKYQQKTLYILGRINLCRIKQLCLQAKTRRDKYFSLILHYLLKLIPKLWFNRLQTKLAIMFNNQDTEFVSHLTNGASKVRYLKYMQSKSELENTINGEFEKQLFPIPRNYNSILSRIFGEYKKLPPIEDQKPHHGIIEINFNTNES